MALATLTTLVVTQRHGWTGDVGAWLFRGASIWRRGLVQWAQDLRIAVQPKPSHPMEGQRLVSLRRWLPALGLGIVFLVLFSVANPVLANWIESAANQFFDLGSMVAGRRILFWLIAAVLIWAALRTRASRYRPGRRREVRSPVSAVTLVRSLIVFNLIFVLQNALDVRHLLFGADLPEGMTYAGYARRGAYPLLAAALLSAAFVLTTFRSTQDRFGPGARRLVYLFLAQNVLLTAFAMVRLAYYVDAYSLTRLRVAAFLWMGLVALGLALIFVRIAARRDNRWLLGANTLAVAGLLYVCCFPNWDRAIAEFNVARCQEIRGHGVPIDLDYLQELGPDALPACRRLHREASEPGVRTRATQLGDEARAELDEQLSTWQGWTRRRERLRATDPAR